MQSFTYHNPTRIIFGEGAIDQAGAEARALGRKALWLYGQQSIKRSGLYDRIRDGLAAAGVEAVELGGVRPNPVASHARQGVALAREHNVDFILATGGGSVIDEAKAIAGAAANGCDPWDLFTRAAVAQGALPLMAVQTNPATGSEMNGGLVLTNDETRDKFGLFCPHLYPRVSILDPEVTLAIPLYVTACSATDSMAHLLEGYFTHRDPWAPIQERYVEGLVKTIMECMERMLADPADRPGRATFMWASTLAWNGMQSAGLGPVTIPSHMLEHPLSGRYDIAHGAGLAIVMPAWMAWSARTDPRPVARFARNVLGITARDGAAAAAEGVATLRRWLKKIGVPVTFAEGGIPAGDIDGILIPMALTMMRGAGMPEYTAEIIGEIYRDCL